MSSISCATSALVHSQAAQARPPQAEFTVQDLIQKTVQPDNAASTIQNVTGPANSGREALGILINMIA